MKSNCRYNISASTMQSSSPMNTSHSTLSDVRRPSISTTHSIQTLPQSLHHNGVSPPETDGFNEGNNPFHVHDHSSIPSKPTMRSGVNERSYNLSPAAPTSSVSRAQRPIFGQQQRPIQQQQCPIQQQRQPPMQQQRQPPMQQQQQFPMQQQQPPVQQQQQFPMQQQQQQFPMQQHQRTSSNTLNQSIPPMTQSSSTIQKNPQRQSNPGLNSSNDLQAELMNAETLYHSMIHGTGMPPMISRYINRPPSNPATNLHSDDALTYTKTQTDTTLLCMTLPPSVLHAVSYLYQNTMQMVAQDARHLDASTISFVGVKRVLKTYFSPQIRYYNGARLTVFSDQANQEVDCNAKLPAQITIWMPRQIFGSPPPGYQHLPNAHHFPLSAMAGKSFPTVPPPLEPEYFGRVPPNEGLFVVKLFHKTFPRSDHFCNRPFRLLFQFPELVKTVATDVSAGYTTIRRFLRVCTPCFKVYQCPTVPSSYRVPLHVEPSRETPQIRRPRIETENLSTVPVVQPSMHPMYGPPSNQSSMRQAYGPTSGQSSIHPMYSPRLDQPSMHPMNGPVSGQPSMRQPYDPPSGQSSMRQPYGPTSDQPSMRQPYGPTSDQPSVPQIYGPPSDQSRNGLPHMMPSNVSSARICETVPRSMYPICGESTLCRTTHMDTTSTTCREHKAPFPEAPINANLLNSSTAVQTPNYTSEGTPINDIRHNEMLRTQTEQPFDASGIFHAAENVQNPQTMQYAPMEKVPSLPSSISSSRRMSFNGGQLNFDTQPCVTSSQVSGTLMQNIPSNNMHSMPTHDVAYGSPPTRTPTHEVVYGSPPTRRSPHEISYRSVGGTKKRRISHELSSRMVPEGVANGPATGTPVQEVLYGSPIRTAPQAAEYVPATTASPQRASFDNRENKIIQATSDTSGVLDINQNDLLSSNRDIPQPSEYETSTNTISGPGSTKPVQNHETINQLRTDDDPSAGPGTNSEQHVPGDVVSPSTMSPTNTNNLQADRDENSVFSGFLHIASPVENDTQLDDFFGDDEFSDLASNIQ